MPKSIRISAFLNTNTHVSLEKARKMSWRIRFPVAETAQKTSLFLGQKQKSDEDHMCDVERH